MDKSAFILIVDDYLLIRTAVRQVLTELGFINVFQAENGKTAQDLMRKQPIDIVIGDWSMPIMSGLELLGWMRKDARYRQTPYMMLTAESNPASVRSAGRRHHQGRRVAGEWQPARGDRQRGRGALDHRGRFFEKYATADKEDGSGLGTYSIRLMAEVQGGGAAMDTGDGHTRLTITLPCV